MFPVSLLQIAAYDLHGSRTLTAVWWGWCCPEALTTPPQSLPGWVSFTPPSPASWKAVHGEAEELALGAAPSSPLAARHPSDPVCRPAKPTAIHGETMCILRSSTPVCQAAEETFSNSPLYCPCSGTCGLANRLTAPNPS